MTHFPKLNRRLAAALVACCCVPLPGWAADDSGKIRALVDAAIRPLMAEHGMPGMAVAVTVADKAFFFNYGVASRETLVPVSETTLFELGSISKTFTATLAAYAQVQGKLSLAEHPSKYMPQFKGYAIDKATLLHLKVDFSPEVSPLSCRDGSTAQVKVAREPKNPCHT